MGGLKQETNVADQLRNVIQAQTVGKDYSPATGQQGLNIDANRARVLGNALNGSGTATVTIAAITDQSPVITQIVGNAASAPTGTLVLTEDTGGTPTVLLTLYPKTTDLNIIFDPPLKASLAGKNLTAVWTTGGSVATYLAVLGFFE